MKRKHPIDHLDDQIRDHIERETADNIAQGMSLDDARSTALRKFGNITRIAEDTRDVWRIVWLEELWQDVVYAARMLWSQPQFTLMALAALILGIGLNTSLFTAINAVLFRPWDVPHPASVVRIHVVEPQYGLSGMSVAAARYLQQHATTLEGAFVHKPFSVELAQTAPGDNPSSPIDSASFVSGNYFEALNVSMSVGRAFAPNEDTTGAPAAVAVLSYDSWMNRYGGRSDVLGRQIYIDRVRFTVIGVAPRNFRGTGDTDRRTEVWVPLAALALTRPDDPQLNPFLTSPDFCCSDVAARLALGVTRDQAQAELTGLYQQFTTQFRTGGSKGHEILLAGTALLDPERRRRVAPVFALLLAAFASILLLACANVGNLLLARAAARQREMAIRAAIGAGRWRLVRQLLAESLLLAALASIGGIGMAYVLPDLVMRLSDPSPPDIRFTPDFNVLAYSLLLMLGSALAFGLAPALQGTRVGVSDATKRQNTQSRSRFPLRSILLGVQVAISVTLLIGAGLLLRGFAKANRIDPGFTTALMAIHVTPPTKGYDDANRRQLFFRLQQQLRDTVGPRSVALAARMPLSTAANSTDFIPTGRMREETRSMFVESVSPGYVGVMGIPIAAGRDFAADEPKQASMLINQSLAQIYWSGKNPIGQSVQVPGGTRTIVGVVRDAQLYGRGRSVPTYFVPFFDDDHKAAFVLVPTATAKQALDMIRAHESQAAVSGMRLSDQVDDSLRGSKQAAQLATALGLLALLLATVGVYGVVSYSVEQRRKEIGIRIALGALPGEVVGFILRRNARAMGIGLLAGLVISIAASRALESQLYGVSRFDPWAYAGVLVLMLSSGMAAAVIPARRAANTDALISLHHD